MKRGFASLVLVAASAALPSGAWAQTAAPSGSVGAENRLFLRFVEDAAVVPSYWLEGQARFQNNSLDFDGDGEDDGEATLLSVGPVFALNVAEDFEFGARVALAHRDPDAGGSETGLTDLDLWGKLSVVTDPVKIALGILLTAPTGDEDKLLGTGETNVEFFGGLRKDYSRLTLAANLGLRVNQDLDIEGFEVEGQNSFLAGVGILVPAGQKLVITGEFAIESERYEGTRTDSRLLGGAEYRTNESFLIRGAVAGGLSTAAPDVELLGSAVWIF
ncbi:MAG TPA: hypothetical protein VJV23_15755 [Candidatus Polarisedimenticolia bacterium]|nr:hypothetical protein [Candidatus Polarisedimenticolia bacterium]